MSSALFPLLLLALVAPPCLLLGRDEGLLLDEPPELKLEFDMRLRFNMFFLNLSTCKHVADYELLSRLCLVSLSVFPARILASSQQIFPLSLPIVSS